MTTRRNNLAVNSLLGEILGQWLELEQSEYCSIACTIASVLSENGKGLIFFHQRRQQRPIHT
jgi:hypothetical protein